MTAIHSFTSGDNPLQSDSMQVWDELIEAVGPASLLVLIEERMSRSLKTHCAAEDIFQEALMHAWRDRGQAAPQWNGVKGFRKWLIAIIDHRICDAADYAGAQKRGGSGAGGGGKGDKVPHQSLGGGGGGGMQTTTPSRVAMYREQAAAMQAALASLPPELVDVVRMRLFQQMPMETIAEHLGIGVAAVSHRFRKGAEIYQRRLHAEVASRSGIHR